VHVAFAKTDRQRQLDESIKTAHRLHLEATKLFDVQSFHDAHTRMREAIRLQPTEPRYYELIARIEMRNPNTRWQKNAEEHWLKAIELDPWNASHRVGLAEQYKNAGLNAKAKREFIHALEVDPKNAEALREVPAADRPTERLVPPKAPDPDDEVTS